MKKRVTGLGGLFFKTKDPEKTKAWYAKHLGLPVDDYGCTFWWKNKKGQDCSTQWSPFKNDTSYFKPSDKPFMVNFRVEHLKKLVDILKKEGVTVLGEIKEYEYGKFAWILDNDENKIELWEPIDKAFL